MIDRNLTVVAVFEFVSLPMLGWLAAAALPWVIHRLYRRQHHITSWAAVELLLAAMQQRSRRIQMQQWLLLAVRTAILVCVALAVAEPGLRGWATGANGVSRTHRIVVLDQSFSMGCVYEEVSRWQIAKAQARQWIDGSNGEPFTLIAWGKKAESKLGRPLADASVLLSTLDELEWSAETADLSVATRSILRAMDRCESELPQIANHQVMFCTDYCQPTWTLGTAQQEMLESLTKRAQITMVDVSGVSSQNFAISKIKVEPEIILRQTEASITATLDGFGASEGFNTRVELHVEGQLVDDRVVEMRNGQSATVQFTHRFVDVGLKSIVVRMSEMHDSLSIDNQRSHVVEVRPQLRVACIAGFPNAAEDIARALAPTLEHSSKNQSIESEVYTLSRLAELNLEDYAAVCLCSVDHLTNREVETLDRYVQHGGALALFLGQDFSMDTNDNLQSLLPASIGGQVVSGDYRFDALDYGHSIVSPFRGQTQAGLLSVAISNYRKMELSEAHVAAETVLQFNSGDPALIVAGSGLGNVAVLALPAALSARTSNGSPWSTFAVSPSFLPVVRELTNYLVSSGRGQQRNMLVGEIAMVPWSQAYQSAEARLPDGRSQSLPLPFDGEGGNLAFSSTDQSGIYSFLADGTERARVAVNVDARECDLRPVEHQSLPSSIFDREVGDANQVAPVRDFSFVRVLLSGALILLLIEIGLAWLLGRGWG